MIRLFFCILLLINQTANAEIISANRTAIKECKEISNRGDEFGEFGSRSRGLSLGTNVSLILLALQEINNIDYSKVNHANNKSIYQICTNALYNFGYKGSGYIEAIDKGYSEEEILESLSRDNNFIQLLSKEVNTINARGGLVVFVSFGEDGTPQ